MLRAARHADTLAIVDILVEGCARSRYAGFVNVDEPYARKLISSIIQRHGGAHDGAGFVMVSERDGRIEAFVAGQLDRVYSIGDMLCAQDCFLLGTKDCPPRVLVALFDKYLSWAAANPKVYEIGASLNDAIPGSENFEDIYLRRGFVECAHTFRRQQFRIEPATASEKAMEAA